MSDIKTVKKNHEQQLMAVRGVVSVGVGLSKSGEQAIIVGVKSTKAADLSAIPKEIDGYRVTIQYVGTVRAE